MQSRVEGEDVKELASALRIESAFCANICLDCASAIAACETKRSIEAILAVRPDCVKAPAFQELPHSRLGRPIRGLVAQPSAQRRLGPRGRRKYDFDCDSENYETGDPD